MLWVNCFDGEARKEIGMKKIYATKNMIDNGFTYTLVSADDEQLHQVVLSSWDIKNAQSFAGVEAVQWLANKFEGHLDLDTEQVELWMSSSLGDNVLVGVLGTDPLVVKEFDLYQEETKKTAIFHDSVASSTEALCYVALGLAGEAGEVANKVKKVIRDHSGVVTEEYRQTLISELGDVLWYAAQLATLINIPLSTVARGNLDKLFDRKERGTLQGDGDKR